MDQTLPFVDKESSMYVISTSSGKIRFYDLKNKSNEQSLLFYVSKQKDWVLLLLSFIASVILNFSQLGHKQKIAFQLASSDTFTSFCNEMRLTFCTTTIWELSIPLEANWKKNCKFNLCNEAWILNWWKKRIGLAPNLARALG